LPRVPESLLDSFWPGCSIEHPGAKAGISEGPVAAAEGAVRADVVAVVPVVVGPVVDAADDGSSGVVEPLDDVDEAEVALPPAAEDGGPAAEARGPVSYAMEIPLYPVFATTAPVVVLIN
jgi:hypothetical protein